MSYHTELTNYTQELDQAVETMDVEHVVKTCHLAIELIKANEPIKLEDKKCVSQFAKSHALAQSLVKEVRDKLIIEAGRTKHARKGIQKYKGVSSNV